MRKRNTSKLAKRRIALGLTQEKMAFILGCDPSYISLIERGLREGKKYRDTLERLGGYNND